MDNETKDYYDEALFQTMANSSDDDAAETPLSELEYRYQMTVPDAKGKFVDIGRDLMLSNLNDNELYVVRVQSELMKDLEHIEEETGIDTKKLRDMVWHKREIVLTSALSKDGYLRENLISQIRKFRLDRKSQDKKKGSKFKLRWNKDEENDSG